MKKQGKRIIRIWIVLEILLIQLSTGILGYQLVLPDRFYVTAGEEVSFNGIYSPLSISASNIGVNSVQESTVKLFGVIPIKSVDIKKVERKTVLLAGVPFGIKLYADGVIIVDMTDVDTDGGNKNPAKEAGLRTGDIITAIDGVTVIGNQEAAKIFENAQGRTLTLTVKRDGGEFETKLTPEYSVSSKTYKAGIWIRDSTAGMGMMTYIEPETGNCVGLGHGISDTDTGVLIPVSGGEICQVKLVGIVKGVKGRPGQLTGCFESGGLSGQITENTECGMYGILTSYPECYEEYEVATKQEVKSGKAQIVTTVEDGTPQKYDIEIQKINYKGTQNFVVKVTDERLLEITGGIVQGM